MCSTDVIHQSPAEVIEQNKIKTTKINKKLTLHNTKLNWLWKTINQTWSYIQAIELISPAK